MFSYQVEVLTISELVRWEFPHQKTGISEASGDFRPLKEFTSLLHFNQVLVGTSLRGLHVDDKSSSDAVGKIAFLRQMTENVGNSFT